LDEEFFMNSLKFSLVLSVLVTFGCGKDQFKVMEAPIKATKIDDTTLNRKTTPPVPDVGSIPGASQPDAGKDSDKNKNTGTSTSTGNTSKTGTSGTSSGTPGSGNDKDKPKNDDKNKAGGTSSSPMPSLPDIPAPPKPPVESGRVKEGQNPVKDEKKGSKTIPSSTSARESGASSVEAGGVKVDAPQPLNLNHSESSNGQSTEQGKEPTTDQKKEDKAEKRDETSANQEQNLALAEFKVNGKSYPMNLKSITLVPGTQTDVKVEMKFAQDNISWTTEHRENDLHKNNAVKLDGDTELYVMAYCADQTCVQYAAGIVFWERSGKDSKIFRKFGITRINGKNQIFVDKAEPNSMSMADWLKYIVEKSK
jgi:hypothetical protein